MEYNKGDLVLVSDGNLTTTCVLLTGSFDPSFSENSFYYTYCIETGQYGIVYDEEIISLVAADFAIDFPFDSQIFDNHYSYYPDLYEEYSYFPKSFPPIFADDDNSDED